MRNAKDDIPPAPGPLSVDTDDKVEFYKNAGCINFDTSKLLKDDMIYLDPGNSGGFLAEIKRLGQAPNATIDGD